MIFVAKFELYELRISYAYATVDSLTGFDKPVRPNFVIEGSFENIFNFEIRNQGSE